MEWLGTPLAVLVVAVLLVSLVVVRRLDDSGPRWRELTQSRFIWGVPWGTLVVIGFVLAVYLFVQDGITDLDDPVVKPFRAWSYLYPLGMVTSSFSHAHAGHLTGNLIGTLVVAPIAEFAWGHYPPARRQSSGHRWLETPWIRAIIVFPGAVIAVGLVTSLFAIGPVIGFSGVVFAFAGFAIVRYPVATLIATIGIQGAVSTIYRAIQNPITVFVAQPSGPSPPSWATIAIQGHALGFFLGLFLAIALFRRRGHRPTPRYLWLAVLLYGFSKSLWAVYWFGGGNVYLLLRGPGVIAVVALAAVIVVAVVGSDRSILPGPIERRLLSPTAPNIRDDNLLQRVLEQPTRSRWAERLEGVLRGIRTKLPRGPGKTPNPDSVEEVANRVDEPDETGPGGIRSERLYELVARPRLPERLPAPSRGYAAVVALLLIVAAISGPAIPVNLFVLHDDDLTDGEDGTLTIEDYTVRYDPEAANPIASVLSLEELDPGSLNASGVIVASPDRQLWTESVSTGQLEFAGSATITVGGADWRESVRAERHGWTPVGNDTVYQVWLESADERTLAYTSPPSQALPLIDGKNVSIVAEDGEFLLEVRPGTTPMQDGDGGDDTSGAAETGPAADPERAPIPDDGDSVTIDGLEFVNDDGDLFVTSGETTVPIASEETYE